MLLLGSDAATARYYPTLSLTGSLEGSSNSLLDLLAVAWMQRRAIRVEAARDEGPAA